MNAQGVHERACAYANPVLFHYECGCGVHRCAGASDCVLQVHVCGHARAVLWMIGRFLRSLVAMLWETVR